MILGKDLNWYFRIIKTTLLIVAAWVIFTGFAGRIPLIGWAFNLLVLPLTWILKLGGAGFVGYKTVKKYKGTLVQALVSGGLFGVGLALASMALSILKMFLRPTAVRMFWGTFGLVAVIFSEAVTGLLFGLIGGVIAGSPQKSKKSS